MMIFLEDKKNFEFLFEKKDCSKAQVIIQK